MSTREHQLSAAAVADYDVIVVGAGITGACAAWDAAARGLRVLLLERGDFGAGTSAHSLKILHGGIRYLQHLDVPRLRQSCRERREFLRMAPHLTGTRPFVVPTYGHGIKGKAAFRAAFLLLGLLTPDRNKGIVDPDSRIPGGTVIPRREVLRRFPGIDDAGLTGAAVFHDGVMLNPPRLVFEIVQTAVEAGAIALNYVNVSSIEMDPGERCVTGVVAEDTVTGETYSIRAKTVINAAGPYAPWIPTTNTDRPLSLKLSRDLAIVVDRISDDPAALAVQTKYRDPDAFLTRGNRHLFMVPWRGYTLIGVNSRVFDEPPDTLQVTDDEIQGFIDEVNEAHSGLNLSRHDVRAVNAGLLPFGDNEAGAKDLSFGKRSLIRDHGAADGTRGLVTAVSVRWTMGRATAEAAVNAVETTLCGRASPCPTTTLSIRGGNTPGKAALKREIAAHPSFAGLPDAAVDTLATCYGSNWKRIAALAELDPAMAGTVTGTSTLRGQVLVAAREESVTTLADIVLRRTDIGTGEQPSDATLHECATIAAAELGWSPSTVRDEVAAVSSLYPFYRSPLPPDPVPLLKQA